MTQALASIETLEQVNEYCWRIPKEIRADMRVDGLVFTDYQSLSAMRGDESLQQVANVACLPGIQYASLAMPDIHWGYGFCIGGVCATDPKEGGVISPGGVGYDINCGVRLLLTRLTAAEVQPRLRELVEALFATIPSGVGTTGHYKFNQKELCRLMAKGPAALMDRGLVTQRDLEVTESQGCLENARPEWVSERALERGAEQCGTLGSGNHFLELQVVDEILDPQAAAVLGLRPGMVCVMIHSGSRGLGYQVCDDALHGLRLVHQKYGYSLPDRQLTCAPVESPEGEHYLGIMRAAANYAWCNRQLLTAQAREVFERFFGRAWEDLGMEMVYDVAHNIAKMETHTIEGRRKTVCVHRKGATRAFPPGHPEVPERYRQIGQPVIIPGDMGRASWVLVGAAGSMTQTFGTTCHGAGRALSRKAAAKDTDGHRIARELEEQGIIARSRTLKGLAEEQPKAYKEVDRVVEVVHQANLSRKVARLRPIGVIKG